MSSYGGFEHNLQSLRIVEKLEKKYPNFEGLNLSFEVKEALKKHQTPWDKPEIKASFISLEAQVVNVADQIAYNNHDIDDGLSSGILDFDSIESNVSLWKDAVTSVRSQYSNIDKDTLRSLSISYIISLQIEDVVKNTQDNIDKEQIHSVEDLQSVSDSTVNFSVEMEEQSKELRNFLYEQFYIHPKVYRMNKKGQNIIKALFDILVSDSKLLPLDYQKKLLDTQSIYRSTADFISGMTDPFATQFYRNLFN